MPKAVYEDIYKDLKVRIEQGEYLFSQLLPSESVLITMYGHSKNTVRRAVARLAEVGYVQAVHGKGVQVIYQPGSQMSATIGGIESFKEFAARNNKKGRTQVVCFDEIECDDKIGVRYGFAKGNVLYYIQRVRYLDEKPYILDISLFLKSEVDGLTSEIAQHSIYDYLELEKGMQIVTSKRQITVEHTTPIDEKYLSLGDYNCVAVLTSHTYNSSGVMFEYTQSRHRPDYFRYQDNATRKKKDLL